MEYLKFAGCLALTAGLFAELACRCIVPLLASLYDKLEKLSRGDWGTGRWGAKASSGIQFVFSIALAYVLTTWSVWCVLRCIVYTRDLENGRGLYFLTGLICCEYALGKIAMADRYRGFFMSVLPFPMAMGAFVVFAMDPSPMGESYPWMIEWLGR